MLRKLPILMLILAFTYISSAPAQEVKKEVKKETKPAVVNDAKKDTKAATVAGPKKDVKKSDKPRTMKWTSCSDNACGFWAKSRSAKELRYIMKRHARRYHKVELADKQLREMVKKEGVK